MTAADVLARLAASTTAVRTMRSGTRLVGEGTGTVATVADGSTLVLTETGSWAPGDGPLMRWRAVSRWHAEGASLAVAHLRQGAPASAVLDRRPDGTWVGRRPHVCGADRYAVSLRLGPEAVEVTWTVDGPAKADVVATRYRPEA